MPPSPQTELPPGTLHNDVLVGHGGQLFLAGGAHAALDYAEGTSSVADASFEAFALNLEQRAKWAADRGAGYAHVIFPDKHSVLQRAFPRPVRVCLGQQYLERCADVANLVLYPLALLRQQQDTCFLKTDTHLSDRGVLAVALAVVARLTGHCDAADAGRLAAKLTLAREHVGDLGAKLTPPACASEVYLRMDWGASYFSNLLSGNNGLVDIWLTPKPVLDKRLLLFGDSFGRSLAKVLSYFFSDVLFLRTPFFHVDIVDQFRPDYILTENVERYLSAVQGDWERPSFHMYPFLGKEGAAYAPPPDFAAAFSAMLCFKRAPYRTFVASRR